jgi:preprotein translocase subunit SecG
MFAGLLVLHVLISIGLVGVVLLQSGKGGGLSGAFGGGGGGSQTLFGGTGAATFLNKATVGLAAGFMVSSLVLAVLGSRVSGGGQESVIQQQQNALPVTVPATPPGGALPVGDGTLPAQTGASQTGAAGTPPAGTEGLQLPVGDDAGTVTGDQPAPGEQPAEQPGNQPAEPPPDDGGTP